MNWIEISDAWVNKGSGNIDLSNIEIDDYVKFYPTTSRYVEGRVTALPHTTISNLVIFKDIEIL